MNTAHTRNAIRVVRMLAFFITFGLDGPLLIEEFFASLELVIGAKETVEMVALDGVIGPEPS
ncbi:hypothetical protein DPMN_140972 [Dreissena polymorpha]|uniref:Uncharacterized protein n=1 Tax=Dreissena polymorpha TaxID=45954 RepID=A0A9D4GEI7_DREPO|nr:hypothetical protein DPMN_140972 [Dreissena polymorpha]